VRNIIVCGHSDCGAMHAHCQGHDRLPRGPLRDWLDMGATGGGETDVNEASRRNVLAQLEHLKGYPTVGSAIAGRKLGLHGLWFDIRHLDVMYYEEPTKEWTVVDKVEGERIMKRLEGQD
jgi:carbonic anhydrase